ncbi:MAG: mobile mystery protein B [Daejeonella sp.]|uniref:mobile mystery protein B n=1 Tax=Daejeonella sp. TaxID=2805397 RepID=UPI002733B259|nr:mobile mystery protein B [Daejeonella sp.]MDP3467815.1 mobile mystery protein B [Daejeonella sp.]
MGLEIALEDGQTPLSEEEKEGLLLRTITTHAELDEHEQLNIEKAVEWTIKTKFRKEQILTEKFIKILHKKMLGEVWSWAGEFRRSERNLGVKWILISVELKSLLDDTRFWIDNNTYPTKEIAIRFKHRLVNIHCFPNGNGRHSRMMADIIMENIFSENIFSWSQSKMNRPDQTRKNYINALKEADRGNIRDLLDFARN